LYRNPIWHFQQGPQQGDGLSFSEALDFFQWRFADLLDREMWETGAITTDAEDLRILRSLPEHAEFVQPLLRGHIAFSCFLSLRFTLTSNYQLQQAREPSALEYLERFFPSSTTLQNAARFLS
jgi:hypothetical protein